ncbi:hypothetical protein, partial [Mesorhizobium sp. M2D.F.Ca.ET.223.01.1.1]|uniref:hypothetical protein n=1 Tax=Mesorhizobium sp. M2D.F.Ca.ET.223.01.1.1 TaxID=2563940 RepID=UPI001675009D
GAAGRLDRRLDGARQFPDRISGRAGREAHPKGPSEPVDIASSKDGWSEFTLSDGTILRAKAVVLDVKKMLGQYTPDGDPVYEMQMTLVSQSRVPEHLKKKG